MADFSTQNFDRKIKVEGEIQMKLKIRICWCIRLLCANIWKVFYIFWKKKIHDATRIVESKFRLFCILLEVIYLRNLKFEKSKFLEIFFFFSLLKIPNVQISCFQIQRKNFFVESKTFSWFQTFFGKIAIDLSVAERFFNKIFNKFNGIIILSLVFRSLDYITCRTRLWWSRFCCAQIIRRIL